MLALILRENNLLLNGNFTTNRIKMVVIQILISI